MLEYDRINISEGIDVNKINASKEYDICYYSYFKDIGFKYEPYFCNDCYGLMQKATNFNDVAIVSIKGGNYRIYFWYISKNDVTKKWIIIIFVSYIKISETTYYQRNRDVILNRAKCYYKSDKERLRDSARENTEIYLKKKKRKYRRNRYHSMSEKRTKNLKNIK